MGSVYEGLQKYKDALIYFKKALKIKFNYDGESNDEVLDLQYKIASVYCSNKQVKFLLFLLF